MAVQSGSYYLVDVDFLRAKYDDVLGHLLVNNVCEYGVSDLPR